MNFHAEPTLRSDQALRDLSIVNAGYVSSYVLDVPKGCEKGLPEWEVSELRAVVGAWRAEFERCQMLLLGKSGQRKKARGKELSREKRIESFVLAKGSTGKVGSYNSCEQMWKILSADFSDIWSYNDRVRCTRQKTYYEMSPSERLQIPFFSLPEEFPQELYDDMSAFVPESVGRMVELEFGLGNTSP